MVLDEEYWIRQCLDALRTYPIEEVIVVDGGSTDATLQVIRDDYPEVHLYENPMPVSFAEQRNFVKSKASGDWILSMDADETYRGLEQLPSMLQDTTYLAYSFPTEHIGTTNNDVDPHVRLFRNIPEIMWTREVHEYLTLDGIPLRTHPAHIGDQRDIVCWTPEIMLVHWAYTAPKEKLRVKARRYMKYNHYGAGIQIDSEDTLIPEGHEEPRL